MFQVLTNAARQRQRRRVEMTWLAAALTRAERLPPLSDLLDGPAAPEPEELQAHMRALAEILPSRSWEEWLRMSSAL